MKGHRWEPRATEMTGETLIMAAVSKDRHTDRERERRKAEMEKVVNLERERGG